MMNFLYNANTSHHKLNLRNAKTTSLKGTIRTHNSGFSFFLGQKNDPPPDIFEREPNYASIIAQLIKFLKL